MADLQTTLQDLTHLDWAERAVTSGTAGTFPKAREGTGENALYYKLSCYDSYRGIYGHECVNELVASRLMDILGVEHVPYRLVRARVRIDNSEYETWLNVSRSYRKGGERKLALDVFYDLHKRPGELPLDLCNRYGWSIKIGQMIVVDYLIANRDRHGANIEIIMDRDGQVRLAPLFDQGLSFVFSCYGDEECIRAFEALRDVRVNNYLGTRSLEENLVFAGRDVDIDALESQHRDVLLAGLDAVLPQCHLDKIWEIVWERWKKYEKLRNS